MGGSYLFAWIHPGGAFLRRARQCTVRTKGLRAYCYSDRSRRNPTKRVYGLRVGILQKECLPLSLSRTVRHADAVGSVRGICTGRGGGGWLAKPDTSLRPPLSPCGRRSSALALTTFPVTKYQQDLRRSKHARVQLRFSIRGHREPA